MWVVARCVRQWRGARVCSVCDHSHRLARSRNHRAALPKARLPGRGPGRTSLAAAITHEGRQGGGIPLDVCCVAAASRKLAAKKERYACAQENAEAGGGSRDLFGGIRVLNVKGRRYPHLPDSTRDARLESEPLCRGSPTSPALSPKYPPPGVLRWLCDRRVPARVTAHRTAVTEKAGGEGSGGPAR
jgi:hypothetical protein